MMEEIDLGDDDPEDGRIGSGGISSSSKTRGPQNEIWRAVSVRWQALSRRSKVIIVILGAIVVAWIFAHLISPRASGKEADGPECHLPANPGIGAAYYAMLAYNATSNVCETFIYGGISAPPANRNRFESCDECLRQCGDGIETTCDPS